MIEKYHIQKKEKEIKNLSDIIVIIKRGKYMTLALCADNHPYAVTISYGYDEKNNCLYMHAAKEGLKIDIIKKNHNVCGTIIEDCGYVNEICTHKYKTCVFEGQITIVEELAEKKYGMNTLLEHLEDQPSILKERLLKNDRLYQQMAILKINISVLKGKASD